MRVATAAVMEMCGSTARARGTLFGNCPEL